MSTSNTRSLGRRPRLAELVARGQAESLALLEDILARPAAPPPRSRRLRSTAIEVALGGLGCALVVALYAALVVRIGAPP